MRISTRRILGLLLAAGLAAAAGCRSAVADFYDDLTRGGAGGTGGTGGIPQECLGDPTADPGVVHDGCGVFVDAAAPAGGDGTKASPLKSVAEAAKLGKGRIFVCARAGTAMYTEEETVVLSGGASMWGGFDACPPDGDWTWSDAGRAALQGPPGVPAVRVAMGDSHVEGFDITAPDAVEKGASSIALVADGAAVDLAGVHLFAGAGAAGQDGVTPSDTPAAGKDADSNSPTDACVMNTIVAGEGTLNTCSDGETRGGNGGKGGTVPANNGEPGKDGSPLPVENPLGQGLGGAVDPGSGQCTNGSPGKAGDLGESGQGGVEKGTLTATGIAGGDGGDGMPGSRGYGGGGGAGSKAGSFCSGLPGAGASGGGGGAGGCGGKGGTGGRAGGSSVGILALNSTFTFSGVLVRTAAGGKGGAGGFGVIGAKGGKGAIGGDKGGGASLKGCDGGAGGDGGNGGSGGGGRGGHSIGIAFKGEAPSIEAGILFEVGSAGGGGAGDPSVMNDGAAGTAESLVDFGAP